jgi:hypothetical protein
MPRLLSCARPNKPPDRGFQPLGIYPYGRRAFKCEEYEDEASPRSQTCQCTRANHSSNLHRKEKHAGHRKASERSLRELHHPSHARLLPGRQGRIDCGRNRGRPFFSSPKPGRADPKDEWAEIDIDDQLSGECGIHPMVIDCLTWIDS